MDEGPHYWGCLRTFLVLAIVVGFSAISAAVVFWVWVSLNWPIGS